MLARLRSLLISAGAWNDGVQGDYNVLLKEISYTQHPKTASLMKYLG